MTNLSQTAWKFSEKIIHAIKQHPFNVELANGTLALDKFAYYIEQDALYLHDFSRAHALIASRAPVEYIKDFLTFSNESLIAEQEVVHHFFRNAFDFKNTGLITPATLSYTSYLLQLSALAPVEVAIAGVLPCFWVYRDVGLNIVTKATPSNPFARWIETYSGDDFGNSVQKAIDIFDRVAEQASPVIREKMIDAFYKSTVLEWHFWNDAYHMTTLNLHIELA